MKTALKTASTATVRTLKRWFAWHKMRSVEIALHDAYTTLDHISDPETLAKAREITRGSTCFVLPVGDRYKVCRRIGPRIVALGYRSDATQLCAWLRKLTNQQGTPAPSKTASV